MMYYRINIQGARHSKTAENMGYISFILNYQKSFILIKQFARFVTAIYAINRTRGEQRGRLRRLNTTQMIVRAQFQQFA